MERGLLMLCATEEVLPIVPAMSSLTCKLATTPFCAGDSSRDEEGLLKQHQDNADGHWKGIDRSHETNSDVILIIDIAAVVGHQNMNTQDVGDKEGVADGCEREIGAKKESYEPKKATQEVVPVIRGTNTTIQPDIVMILSENTSLTRNAVKSAWRDSLPAHLTGISSHFWVLRLIMDQKNCWILVSLLMIGCCLTTLGELFCLRKKKWEIEHLRKSYPQRKKNITL